MTRRRLTTAQRGYGARHQARRARWQALIDAGYGTCKAPICLMPSRDIPPGTPWDLGHDHRTGRTRGPEHVTCNRADGGRRRWLKKPRLRPRRSPGPFTTSQDW